MKKLLILPILLLALSLSGCPQSTVTPTNNADQIAAKSVVTIGQALATVPGVCQTLLDNGKINKDQYNSIVPVYKKAKAAYVVANDAMQAYLNSTDQATAGAKLDQAMADLNKSFGDLRTLINSFGGAI